MNKAQTVKEGLGAGSRAAAERPRRLGRGLSSLLGTPVRVEIPLGPVQEDASGAEDTDFVLKQTKPVARDDGGRIVMVGVGEIVANRFQPRRMFEEAGLAELAASIRSAGVVQPVLLRRSSVDHATNGEGVEASYELIAGERRWRAARLAGLGTIPAVVSELSDEQAAEWALVENVQRADLSAMEQAYAVRQLCEKFGLTHQQAADKLGMDRTSITNLVRLTDLEPETRGLMESGALSAGHGKALLSMAAGPRRTKLAQRAADAGWSVRRLGGAVAMMIKGDDENGSTADAIRAAAILGGDDLSKGGMARDSLAHAGMRELEKQLGEHLGTKVRIRVRVGGKKGSLMVQFFDLDHFDGLMSKMGFVMK